MARPDSAFSLSWLPAPPDNVRAIVRALKGSAAFDAKAFRGLALTDLDVNQLESVSRALSVFEGESEKSGLAPFKLAIAASHTMEMASKTLPATALRHALHLKVHCASYGQAAQQLLEQGSDLARARPDAVLLAFDRHSLGLDRARLDNLQAETAIEEALGVIASLVAACHRNVGAPAIVQTLVPPQESLFGSFDASIAGSVRAMTIEFNAKLARRLRDGPDAVFDVAHLAAIVGLQQWQAPRLWYDAKIPFAVEAIALYNDHLCRILAALRGLARKCLVLDLDNTLWGGVIGDDGLEGIRIGQGCGTGEAFLAIQAMALELRQRGILLAVSSKNDEPNARLPFYHHAEMLLRETHFSVFQANWDDKASNLVTIARTLNIGTEALVFLDDNPAEREQVRQSLPEVAVPEVGDNPSEYVRTLMQAGYFEALAFAEEDRRRADMYGANLERSAFRQQAGDLAEYLRSLEMVCTIVPFDDAGRSRIAQLINKSNQFNLTTRRRTEAEVQAIACDPGKLALQIRLADRFGDNGMICIVIFDRLGDLWHCDTWLMSCRVLGRRVEEAVLAHVAKIARAAGVGRLTGEYIPSAKNALVRDHFAKLGFVLINALPDGTTHWELELAHYTSPDLPIKVAAAMPAHG
ncbi:HAD-IIIC family phosphatase [Novosphingobium album (ex Liu et al. 2023)]|uniref:HAD-IIIC family phosphatase n=1 Tax=Novosphingobium album (ex Liu et al. 2023) TaxID=3031130 RepID=A0ABT5WQ83_9SPHN|nr:HAD-IIIC family phosphatase [Novosphingobium album (ex Liu et al. 2023)]MDE8652206.1 HAD-IIIC family phosphatase [Novosphingobium album (ex Liu et al. 2023)]